MGVHNRGNIDFTSCITPMCKALEVELAEYFYTGYIKYLKENNVPISSFRSKRSFITDESAYSFCYRDPDKLEYFTLGSLDLVMGIDRKTRAKKGFVEVVDKETQRKELVMVNDNDEHHSSIDDSMLAYIKTIFKENALGKIDRDRAITDYLIDLATEIKAITDSFRNPAAHANVMSYERAETCANYLIKSKKLIAKFLEKIDFSKIEQKEA